eukprot:CAMPEP_0197663148 /NCGR_PEP_ID=MMETSP1338-20131121/56293_1 /TAXON_ID=43686 ORGANISM="Pelagodinium beii, Strain RCC1491" /NCGR_SAMPLE_ID=MMETSP1338 /ASSEMBLY_ACC=CAM_ASM_000754 /LENGTH=189 /DNA_ID=CAMNT_0043241375 /DNA_START=21 /DNA_END=590 /DNA_ORIENTATION=+
MERQRMAAMLTDSAAAAVAVPAPIIGNLGRHLSAPQLPPLSGYQGPAFQKDEEKRVMASTGFSHKSDTSGRSLPGTTRDETWAALFEPSRQGVGMPGPISGASAAFTSDQLHSTVREAYRADMVAVAARQQRAPAQPARRASEDHWARGWDSTQTWAGRKKEINVVYSDQVWSKLGKVVDRDRFHVERV